MLATTPLQCKTRNKQEQEITEEMEKDDERSKTLYVVPLEGQGNRSSAPLKHLV